MTRRPGYDVTLARSSSPQPDGRRFSLFIFWNLIILTVIGASLTIASLVWNYDDLETWVCAVFTLLDAFGAWRIRPRAS